jgi:hypothetical protein
VINIHNKLNLDVEVDHALSLEFDDSEGVVISTYISIPGDDEPNEVDTPFERLIEECLELYKFDSDYQKLYCVAHELARFSEKLREIAQAVEDSTLVEDLFKVDMNDLPEVEV